MADPKSQIEAEENTVSSHTGWDGPNAPPRDKRVEHQYQRGDLDQGVNRTDDKAPRGPVNIGVKGGAEAAGPEAAGQTQDRATGMGKKDSTAGLAQE